MACGCAITSGIAINCDALKRVGGTNKLAYVFNVCEVASYTFDSSGYITAINFETYGGLYKFESRKQSHSGGYTATVQDPGGNKFFQHDTILKLFPETPEDDAVIEDILVADVGIILLDLNQRFFLYGTENGMEQTAGVQNTGQAPASDIADTLTFTGFEQDKPKRVLDTDFATTKALLESYVI